MKPSLSTRFLLVLAFVFISPTLHQQVLTNIQFDCKGRLDGFWRDGSYCDVFHACVAGEQKRSYGCPQVGERFYFDDTTQKCEFASRNTGGCQGNQYYTPVTNATTVPGSQLSTQAPTEQWKIFVNSKEQFSCANQPDGFYASRWCNVFYRCFSGITNAFLCPLKPGGGRLWWVGHGTQQNVQEASAACTYPCDTGRPCTSAGGIIVDNGNQISESQQEADTVYKQSVCTNQTSQTNTGSTGSGQTGSGQQTGSNTATSTGQTSTGQQVCAVCPTPSQSSGSTTGQTGGSGNQGTSSSTGGTGNQGGSSSAGGSFTVTSDVSCQGQQDGTFLASPYCNVFHRCVSGSRFDFRCARAVNSSYDLWWNEQTNLCDWPCRVQCNKQLYDSSTSAQQVQSESLLFFNNDCRAYPIIFNRNK